MSYLLDKRNQRRRLINFSIVLVVLLVIFYFRNGIFKNLSFAAQKVFHPVFLLSSSTGEKFGGIGSYFSSKDALTRENENLKSQLNDIKGTVMNYDSLAAENASLKEILGRKNEKTPLTLASVLAKPNQSPYDTLLVDIGTNKGAKSGNLVFALGNIPIGKIAEAYPDSSKVVLFSNSGEKTQVILTLPNGQASGASKDTYMEIVGRGGGNFEMIIPRDLTLQKGDQVVLPGVTPYVAGVVQTIVSDPRDPFVKALLVAPVNVQNLKFVQVELQK